MKKKFLKHAFVSHSDCCAKYESTNILYGKLDIQMMTMMAQQRPEKNVMHNNSTTRRKKNHKNGKTIIFNCMRQCKVFKNRNRVVNIFRF